jgi:hypothetical protein
MAVAANSNSTITQRKLGIFFTVRPPLERFERRRYEAVACVVIVLIEVSA